MNKPMIAVEGLTKTYQKKTPKEGAGFWSKLLPAGQKVEEQIGGRSHQLHDQTG